jgi:hypothetical protein
MLIIFCRGLNWEFCIVKVFRGEKFVYHYANGNRILKIALKMRACNFSEILLPGQNISPENCVQKDLALFDFIWSRHHFSPSQALLSRAMTSADIKKAFRKSEGFFYFLQRTKF